jgi:hypothetical protein
MTPAPATASARRQASARPATRRSPAPRAPRRVSGPARPRTLAGATVARPVALPRPVIGGGLAPRLGAWVRNLPDHRLLDRLIRGRAWIVLIGVLLTGIVALQVSMLKLNSGISRAVEHEQSLQRENQAMQASVAALGNDGRLGALAERQGYYNPVAGSERYLSVGAGDAQRAARGLKPPQAHPPTPTQTATPPAATTTTGAAAPPPATTTTPTGTSSQGTSAGTPTTSPTTTAPQTGTTGVTGTTGGTATTGTTAPTTGTTGGAGAG